MGRRGIHGATSPEDVNVVAVDNGREAVTNFRRHGYQSGTDFTRFQIQSVPINLEISFRIRGFPSAEKQGLPQHSPITFSFFEQGSDSPIPIPPLPFLPET
ncbi:hypothetical protein V6N11_056798 [Hibiscus sabdariffa]|uniref:Uncharacterized protein n=1 Tax=Hibiscus sabdariffa TaxID=183260 RepID=A0ABR2T4V3_9ROSI